MKGLEIIEQVAVNQVPESIIICMILGALLILIPTFVVYLFTKDKSKSLATESISGIVYVVLVTVLLFSRTLENQLVNTNIK